jgi:DNA-damage-inducible protein J
MAANAVVRARIDEKTKKKATRALKAIGMTPSSAFRVMMTRVASDKNPPYDLLVPNAETIEAIEEGRRGGQKTFNTIDELMADLFADE